MTRVSSTEIRQLRAQVIESCTDDNDLAKCYECMHRLVAVGKAAAPALLRLARNPIDDVRLRAVEALGQIGDPSVGPYLESILDADPDEDVQGAAASALARLKAGQSTAPMIRALKTTDRGKRFDTVAALARLRAREAVPRLLEVATQLEESGDQSASVIRAAVTYIEQGISGIAAVLDDPSCGLNLRRAVVAVLGHSGRQEALSVLLSILQDSDESLRAAALRSIGDLILEFRPLDAPVATNLVAHLERTLAEDKSAICRLEATIWLGALNLTDVVPALQQAGKGDPDAAVRAQAQGALKRLRVRLRAGNALR